MRIKAVIFDMDGVIIDSEGLWQQAQIAVLAERGVTITASECEALTKGKRIDELVATWIKRYSLNGDAQALEGAITGSVCRMIEARGAAMPGLYQAIRYFHDSGYRLALATSSCPQIIDAVFDKLTLWPWFEIICSASSEAHGKPHPDVYLTALRKLALEPGECRVIEDSVNGFNAAVGAAIKTWVVAPDASDQKFATAEGRYHSLPQLIEALRHRELSPHG